RGKTVVIAHPDDYECFDRKDSALQVIVFPEGAIPRKMVEKLEKTAKFLLDSRTKSTDQRWENDRIFLYKNALKSLWRDKAFRSQSPLHQEKQSEAVENYLRGKLTSIFQDYRSPVGNQSLQ
ncbi:hypothetical protein HDU96_003294, partial [Phlyctochytrium bullatum]